MEHYGVYQANSGAISFRLKLLNFGSEGHLALLGKNGNRSELYQITLGLRQGKFLDLQKGLDLLFDIDSSFSTRDQFVEYWLTWHNSVIKLGSHQHIFLDYSDDNIITNEISYVKFYLNSYISWEFKGPPNLSVPMSNKIFEEGQLKWLSMTGNQLPPDALIGGFEREPLYIARAMLNGSLCPGKFVYSKGKAYIPWGSREHAKEEFELLCGYNAIWVKTNGRNIPENAFVAGYSEVRQEPLYICRAVHGDHLIPGKVHTLHGSGYLPYEHQEVEINEYEILVEGHKPTRSEHRVSH